MTMSIPEVIEVIVTPNPDVIEAIIVGPQGPAGASLPADTDPTLAANSDLRTPTQKAVKAYGVSLRVPNIKTGTYTAVSGDFILADTSGGSFTLTLPASPATGAAVRLIGNGWDVHNLTVARNGQTIDGAAENLICDFDADLLLIYLNSTWTY